MGLLCCCKGRDDLATFFGCMPLALSAIFICLLILWAGAFNIYAGVVSTTFPSMSTIVTVIIGSLECLCGLLGLLGVIVRIRVLVNCLSTGFSMILGAAGLFFILTWIGWIIDWCATPPWSPNGEEIAWIVIYNILNILLFASAYFIYGLINSLTKVISVGGTGWEKLNYIQIQELQEEEGSTKSFQSGRKGEQESMNKAPSGNQQPRDLSDVSESLESNNV